MIDLKRLFGKNNSEEYLEIDVTQMPASKEKIKVRPFTLKKYDDINDILNSLREGYTIAVIDIKPLKNKDVIELKRAVSKIKKTVEALQGSIAGFGDFTLLVAPDFAEIHKAPAAVEEKKTDMMKFY